jgi:hypothetical protein
MKNLTKHLFLAQLFFTLLIYCSCNQGLYSPINEVMHSTSSKGELELGINFNHSTTSKIQSSISYSPIEHIGLSFSNISSTSLKSNSLAIGYYTKNMTDKENKKLFLDAYLGACLAKHNDFFSDYDNLGGYSEYDLKCSYTKLFTQLGYHKISKSTRFDMVAKVNYVDWSKIEVFGNVSFSKPAEELKANEPFIFFELNPKLSFGPEFYKLNVGCNYHIPSTSIKEMNRFIAYTGVSINLNRIFSSGLLAGDQK